MANAEPKSMTPAAAVARHLEWLEFALTAAREEETRRKGRLDRAVDKNRDKRSVRLAEVSAEVRELAALVEGLKEAASRPAPALARATRARSTGARKPASRSTRSKTAAAKTTTASAATKPKATTRARPKATPAGGSSPASATSSSSASAGPKSTAAKPRRSRGRPRTAKPKPPSA
jgi:type VI protein secretion system component VasK